MVCCDDEVLESVGREEGGEEFVFLPSQGLRQWQHQMAVLLQQQRERGGVIDLTNTDDVIDLTWVWDIVWSVLQGTLGLRY